MKDTQIEEMKKDLVTITDWPDNVDQALKEREAELNKRIGFLRQWLNEDRITDPDKMVTNAEIMNWLSQEEVKEYKDCKYCGEKVIAPHEYDYHFSCQALEITKEPKSRKPEVKHLK